MNSPVLQSGGDDLPAHGIGQGDVRPDVEAEPRVGPLRGAGAPGVDREEPSPVMDALQ